MTRVAKRHPHGTVNAYEFNGCRCEDCALARYRYATRQRAGLPTGRERVSSGPVADHLTALISRGWDSHQIAAVTGDSSRTIDAYARRQRPTMLRSTARRLLAVTHEQLMLAAADGRIPGPDTSRKKRGALVDAAPTRRRLQALAIAGWSPYRVARNVGVSKSPLYRIRAGVTLTVYPAVEAAVRDHFDWMLRHPVDKDPRSRALAVASGWLPAGAWADINTGDLDDEQEAAA